MFLERLIYSLKRYTVSVFVSFVFVIRSFVLNRTETVHVCEDLIKKTDVTFILVNTNVDKGYSLLKYLKT